MSILDEIIEFKKCPNELKDRAIQYIADVRIPLKERWNVFKEMPYGWKNRENYIHHFDSEKLFPSGEISWYDDFYIEKYETVEMVFFVEERLTDKLLEMSDMDFDDLESLPPEGLKIVDSFREEILSKNLGSFEFNW